METTCRFAEGNLTKQEETGCTIRFPARRMNQQRFRFGNFVLDSSRYELTCDGHNVALERIPMDLLILLATAGGRLVNRHEIIEHLWGKDVFLDTDNSINTAIRKIRRAIEDGPGTSRYIETIAGKGYRFRGKALAADLPLPNVTMRRRIMLAVLPFENLSGDPAQEYLSDGLTEETIMRLGQLSPEELGVIARTSSMAYKHSDKTVRQIGSELGVDYVVEGSVRRDGDRVRVTAQLIRTADQIHLWAENFDRTVGKIIEIQSDVAAAVAAQVKLKVRREQNGKPASRRDTEAYDLYLRGRYHVARVTRSDLVQAISCFEDATARDPQFALAYSGLADSYARMPITSDIASNDAFPKAQAAAERALAIEPDSAEAHTSQGTIRFWFHWDWQGAEQANRKAIQLNANYSMAHLMLAHTLSNIGQHQEAIETIQQARLLDPLSLITNAMYGQFLYQAGRVEESIRLLEAETRMAPSFWVTQICLAKSYEAVGRYADAIAACQQAWKCSSGNTEALSLMGYVHAVSGKVKQGQDKLRQLLELEKHRFVPPYNIALVLAGLKEFEKAMQWLNKAYEGRDVHLTFLRDHKWKSLRKLSSFKPLYARMKFPGS
jgi:TolB-like protein/Tfp pilus assembly protein PilF